jgi:hypothetical protein|tara:strand:- start:2687 stop:2845 length:159 start_codon:yes stop_codon:yes gene_type:complete
MHMMPANLSLEDGELSYIDRWERMSIKIGFIVVVRIRFHSFSGIRWMARYVL